MTLLGTLRTSATLENLHLLTDFVHSIGHHLELDDRTLFHLDLAVEEAAALARPFQEEAVHGGRQPHQAQDLGQPGLTALGFAVDAHDAPLAFALGIGAGADLDRAGGRRDRRRHGPGRRRGHFVNVIFFAFEMELAFFRRPPGRAGWPARWPRR